MSDQEPYRYYKPADIKARRTRWIWIGLGVLLAAFLVWLIAPHGEPASTTPGAAGGRGGAAAAGGPGGGRGGGRGGRGGGAPATVGAAKAVKGDVPIYIYALGTATPAQTVTVRAQISGQLLSVAFKEGQMVAKGQLLAQVDPRPYEQALLQAEGTLAHDQALLDNARIDLKRYQTLLSQDSIASQQVDTQKALVRQYEGTIKNDQAAIAAQKLNLIYCRITSPVTGRVGLRQVDAGNYVTAGDTNGIVVVTEVTPIDVLFTVPEDNLAQVNKRTQSGAVLQAAAFDRTQKTQLALGQLLTLDNQVDTTTGTVRAKARFDNRDGSLYPNQFVNIRLLVDTLHDSVIIPTSAVLRGANGLFVWVVNPPANTVEMRTVKTGPAVGDNTAISSGLDPDEIVVTDGSDRLRDGQKVFLPGDCIPAGYGRAGGAPGAGAPVAGGAAGGRGGAGGAPQADPPKTLFNLFGLLSPKTKAADPMAGMRCKPGQRPGGTVAPTPLGDQSTAAPSAAGPGSSATAGAPGAGVKAAPRGAGQANDHGAAGAPLQGGGAPAQGGGAAGGGSAGGGHMSARLQAMFAPLNLDPAQQAKIQAITDAGRPKIMAAYQSGDMAGGKAAREAMDKQIDGVLRPDQKSKMTELRAQMRARMQGGGGGGGPQ